MCSSKKELVVPQCSGKSMKKVRTADDVKVLVLESVEDVHLFGKSTCSPKKRSQYEIILLTNDSNRAFFIQRAKSVCCNNDHHSAPILQSTCRDIHSNGFEIGGRLQLRRTCSEFCTSYKLRRKFNNLYITEPHSTGGNQRNMDQIYSQSATKNNESFGKDEQHYKGNWKNVTYAIELKNQMEGESFDPELKNIFKKVKGRHINDHVETQLVFVNRNSLKFNRQSSGANFSDAESFLTETSSSSRSSSCIRLNDAEYRRNQTTDAVHLLCNSKADNLINHNRQEQNICSPSTSFRKKIPHQPSEYECNESNPNQDGNHENTKVGYDFEDFNQYCTSCKMEMVRKRSIFASRPSIKKKLPERSITDSNRRSATIVLSNMYRFNQSTLHRNSENDSNGSYNNEVIDPNGYESNEIKNRNSNPTPYLNIDYDEPHRKRAKQKFVLKGLVTHISLKSEPQSCGIYNGNLQKHITYSQEAAKGFTKNLGKVQNKLIGRHKVLPRKDETDKTNHCKHTDKKLDHSGKEKCCSYCRNCFIDDFYDQCSTSKGLREFNSRLKNRSTYLDRNNYQSKYQEIHNEYRNPNGNSCICNDSSNSQSVSNKRFQVHTGSNNDPTTCNSDQNITKQNLSYENEKNISQKCFKNVPSGVFSTQMRIHPPYNIICNSAQIPDKSENICYCPSNDILSNNFNSKTTKNESIYESDQDRPNRSSCTIYHEQNQNKCNFDKEKKKFQETSNSFFTKRTIQKSNECSPCGIYIDDYIIDINNEANQKYFKEKQSPQNDSLKLACKCYNTTLKEGEEEDFRNIKEESNSICCPQSTYNSNFNNQSIVNRESLNHNWKNKKLCNVLNNDDLPCQGNECNKDNEIANMRDINTRYSPERCVAQENYRNKNMEDSVSQRDWYCGITHEGLKIRSDKDLNMFKNDSEDRLISERNTNKYSNWDNYRQISPTLAEHSRPRNISSCCGYQHIVSNTRIEGERSKQNSFKINGRSNCTNYSGKSANIFYNTNDQHTQDENISHQSQSNKECRSSQYSYKLQKINHCSNLVAVPANQLTNNYFNLMNCSDFVYVQKHSQMEKNAVCKDESHDSVSEPKCYNYTLDRSEKSIVHEMRTNQLSTNTSGKCFHLLEGEDRKRERKTEMYNSPYLIKCSSSSYENPQLFQTTQKEYNNVDGDDFCCCIIKDQNSSRHSGKGSGNQSSSLLTNNYCEQKRCDNCTNSFLSSKIDRNSEVCNNEQDCPKNSQHFYKQCHNKSCAYFRNTNNNNFGCPHSNASITLKYEQENSLTEGRKSNHIACKCNQNVKKINITNALMCNCGRHFNTRPIEDVNIQKSNLPEGQARSCSIYYPAETHAKKNNHCSCHKPKRYYKKTAPVNDVNERLLESNTTQCEEKNNNHCSCHKPKRYYKKNTSVNNDASERLLDSNNIQCEDKDICQRPKNGVKSNEVKQSRLMKLCSRCCKRRRNREVDSTCYINKQTQPNEKSYTDEKKCLCSCEPSENKINVGSSNDFYKPRGREIYFNLGSSSYNLRDENNILNNEPSDRYANHSNLKSNILCTCGESKRRRKGKNSNSHTRSKNDKICTCDGRDLEEFNQLTSIKSQHSFENENNVCICTRRKGSEQGRNEDDTLKCLCNGDIICSRVYNSSHMSKNDQKCTCGGYEFNERRNNKSQQNYKNDNNVTKEISQSNIKSCLCTRCGSSEREKKDDDTIKCICDVAITKLLCSCEPSEKTCNVGSCNYISVPRGHEIYFNLDSSSYNLVDENTVLNSKHSDCCVNHINQKSNILCTSNENNRQSKEVNPISKRDTICTCEGSDFEEFNQHKNNKSQRSFENDTGCKGSERETNEDDTLKCVCDGDIICNRVSLAYCYNHIDPKLGKCQCSSPCTLDNNKILDNKEILKTRRISEKCYRSDIRTYSGLKRNSYFTIGNSDIDKIKKRKMEKKEKQCQLSATRIKHFDYISTHSNTSRDCGKPFRRCNITFQYSKELKRKSARVMPYIHDKYSKQKSNRQISHQTIAREPTKSARTSCSQCGFCKKKTHTRERYDSNSNCSCHILYVNSEYKN